MKIPKFSCDSHMHVLGPQEKYPASPNRLYTPTEKSFHEYLSVSKSNDLQRAVLVQPSAYGFDNSYLLDTLRLYPENARGVVVIDPLTADATLDAMHSIGVRGIRLNLMTPRISNLDSAKEMLYPLAERLQARGWHLQIYADTAIFASIAPILRQLKIPVVLDHVAGVRSTQGVDDPDFQTILQLLSHDNCWVKVSGADIVSRQNYDFSSAAPYMRAIIHTNPENILWGTDWPHLVHFSGPMGVEAPLAEYRPVNESRLLELLFSCAQDDTIVEKILVFNPHRIYDF